MEPARRAPGGFRAGGQHDVGDRVDGLLAAMRKERGLPEDDASGGLKSAIDEEIDRKILQDLKRHPPPLRDDAFPTPRGAKGPSWEVSDPPFAAGLLAHAPPPDAAYGDRARRSPPPHGLAPSKSPRGRVVSGRPSAGGQLPSERRSYDSSRAAVVRQRTPPPLGGGGGGRRTPPRVGGGGGRRTPPPTGGQKTPLQPLRGLVRPPHLSDGGMWTPPPAAASDEGSLLASMARRLAAAEKEVREARHDANNKDRAMERLKMEWAEQSTKLQQAKAALAEAKAESARRAPGEAGEAVRRLEKDNGRLRRQNKEAWAQVADLKKFLNDYGMVWVGGGEAGASPSPPPGPSPRPGPGGRPLHAAGASAPPEYEQVLEHVPAHGSEDKGFVVNMEAEELGLGAEEGAEGAGSPLLNTQQQQARAGAAALARLGGAAVGGEAAEAAGAAEVGEAATEGGEEGGWSGREAAGDPLLNTAGQQARAGAAALARLGGGGEGEGEGEQPSPPPAAAPIPAPAVAPRGPAPAAPPAAVAPAGAAPFPLDMALLSKRVRDLNIVAGDGRAEVVRGPGNERRLRMPDPLVITLWRDGIQTQRAGQLQGPFRSFTAPATRAVVEDIADGYFPYELKDTFPEGVPIKLVDRSSIDYDSGAFHAFAGSGNRVAGGAAAGGGGGGGGAAGGEGGGGGFTNAPRDLASIEAGAGGPTSSADFLAKLPNTVIRNGKVIGVRSEVEAMLKGGGGGGAAPASPDVVTLDTGAGGGAVTTLRVKSEDGKKTFIVKMGAGGTVGDVRAHIDRHRGGPGAGGRYEIRSAFPAVAYEDGQTLEAAGLVPSAALFLRARS